MLDPANLEILQSALVRVAVVTLMVSVGLRVRPATILESRRQRFAIGTTLVLALLFVPAVAWVTVRLIGVPDPVAAGILLIAAAPGGSLSLKLVDLAEGDIALGLGLFFALAAIAPFSMPLTAAALIGPGATVSIDALALFATLVVLQLVPLVLAVAIARIAPGPAARFGAVATRLATVFLIGLIVVAVIVNADEIVAIGLNGLLGFVLVTTSALVAGLVLGRSMPRAARTMAFLASQRSASLALLVAISIGLPGTTGAVLAGGLVMLMINPATAILLSTAWPMQSAQLAKEPGGTSRLRAPYPRSPGSDVGRQ